MKRRQRSSAIRAIRVQTDQPNGSGSGSGLLGRVKWSYLIAGVGLIASVLAVIKTAPDAWGAAMRMAGRPACVTYAKSYTMVYGRFGQVGDTWSEFHQGSVAYEFEEIGRDLDYIYLKNLTPRPAGATKMLRLPACGGMAQEMRSDSQSWRDLMPVRRA